MTPEQIRERCAQFISVNSAHGRIVLSNGFNSRLESLYREAMAEGLERAADNYVRYKPSLLPKAGCAPWPPQPFEDLLRAEAQRVKEGT